MRWSNFLENTLLFIGGAVFGYYSYNFLKEEKVRVKKEFEKKEEKLKKLEIAKKLSKEEKKVLRDYNIPSTYRLAKFLYSKNWKSDLLYIDDLYGTGEEICSIENFGLSSKENSIHVFEETYNSSGEKLMTFCIQIPPYSKLKPLPSDYFREIKKVSFDFWERNKSELGIDNKPKIKYKGFYTYVDLENPYEFLEKTIYYKHSVEIPEDDYKDFSTGDKNDGLGRLVDYYNRNGKENLKNSGFVGVDMFVAVSFYVPNVHKETGMDEILATEFLDSLVDLEINDSRTGKHSQDLGPIIFHPGDDLEYVYNSLLHETVEFLSEEEVLKKKE